MAKGFTRVRSGQVWAGQSTRKATCPIDKAKAYEVIWDNVSYLFEVTRNLHDRSYVYVIGEHDGALKIGRSADPIGRLRTMQTGNPRRLRIEHVLVGDQYIEKLLHDLWEPFAIRSAATQNKPEAAPGTEWFKPEARGPRPATSSTRSWRRRPTRR